MNTTRTVHRRCLAGLGLSIALTATFALTSCANPVEKLTESIGYSAADAVVSELSGGKVQGIGATEVPDDFPDSITLPDAGIASAMRHTDGGVTSWIIHFDDSANDAVFDSYIATLSADGFAEELSHEMAGAMRMAHYTNGEYILRVSLLGTADDDQIMQLHVLNE